MKYFLHDTSAFDDEKISELFINFGYEGLGLFYTALERIGKQEKPIKTDVLLSQLRVGKRLTKCWLFIEQIGLISSSNGESFNEQLLNFSEKYQINKEKTREKVAEWRQRQLDAKNVTSYVPVSNPPKVKESKVNINKEESNKENDFLTKTISAFQKSYFETFQTEYIITNKGKERAAAGKIIKLYKSKYPDSNSEETLKGLADFFEKCCTVSDDWLQKNMSLSIIVSKFNEIKNIIKNGTKKIKSVASRSSEIESIVNAVYDSKGFQ